MSKVIAYKVTHDSEYAITMRLLLDSRRTIEIRANRKSDQHRDSGISLYCGRAIDTKAYIKNYGFKLLK